MYSVRSELLAELRDFAKDPGALFMLIKSPYGRVPIWVEDIKLTSDDAELQALVSRCVDEYIGVERT
jgi:hypothetical protein